MSPLIAAVLIASTLLDGFVAGWILFRPGEVRMRRVWLAFVLGCVVFGPKAVVLTMLAGSFFFLINLAYTSLVVLLPVLGLACLLVARRRPVTRPVCIFAALALCLAPVGYYATFVEPFRLACERVTVPLAPTRAGSQPVRVAVLSDIQSCEVTEHLREAVRLAMEFEPHLILLPGDLLQCDGVAARERGIVEFRDLLAPLEAPLGAWFVLGNCDRTGTVERVLEGTSIRLLKNETVALELGERRILLAGADFGSRSEDFIGDLSQVARPDQILLLFAHYPDSVYYLNGDTRVDLLVAGHTHGGQIVLPFFGPPLTLSRVPRAVAAGGLHSLEGTPIYVSRGLGAERNSAPRVRFNCPPELSLLTLGGPLPDPPGQQP